MTKINFSFFLIITLITLFSNIFCIKEWWEDTKVPILNDTNFYDIVGHDKYVVVNFFTRTCIFCQNLSPEYEKFYELYLTKREDVLVTKIECFQSRNICLDYAIFAFPFITIFFPHSKKMKSVFKFKRIAEEFDNWVNMVAPKKNLKPIIKEEEKDKNKNNITNSVNMTKIEDYILKQFSEVKKDINDIEKYFNESLDELNKNIDKDNDEFDEEDNDNVIEIKITPFFIVKCVGIFFLIKYIMFYVRKFLFRIQPLPKDIHQKN